MADSLKKQLQVHEGGSPVTTPWGAAVSLALILGLLGLAIAAFHFGTPTTANPPNPPQSYTTEAVQLYEKASSVYQTTTRDKSSFVKDVLLVIAPALTAVGGYVLGRQSKSG